MKNKYSIAFLLLVLVCIACKTTQETQPKTEKNKSEITQASGEKRNIIFIAVDDLKPLLSNYGYSQMHTPNFDRLAEMGVTFTNAHVQYAVCGPSRASVMTGTYPDRTKVWDLHTNFRKSAPDLISIPEYLIGQGYETWAVGKIYHKGSSSEGHDGKSWSIPHELPDNYDPEYGNAVFNYYQNPTTKKELRKLIKEAEEKGKNKRNYAFKRLKPSTESADVSDNAYQDGLYVQAAIEKLNVLAEGTKPFFLGVGFQKPHLPFIAPQKYWDLYKREEIELAEFQQLSEGTPDFAFHNFGELRAYSDIPDKMDAGDRLPEEKQRELIHGYMACVSYIDAQLGKLLDALEEKDLLQNSVIVLWGDHGFHLGDHTEWCKHSNFEQATKIPFMFAGPSVERNLKVDHPVNLVDLFPTVFEMANVPNSSQTEGKSLVPLMDNDNSTSVKMDYAISQYERWGGKMGYAMRTDRYRYTEWHKDYVSTKPYSKENIVGRELYDYEKDPLETKNLVEDPAYKEIVEKLHLKLKNHLESYDQ